MHEIHTKPMKLKETVDSMCPIKIQIDRHLQEIVEIQQKHLAHKLAKTQNITSPAWINLCEFIWPLIDNNYFLPLITLNSKQATNTPRPFIHNSNQICTVRQKKPNPHIHMEWASPIPNASVSMAAFGRPSIITKDSQKSIHQH